MNRGVIAYMVALVLIIIVALYLSGYLTGGKRVTTTTTIRTSTSTTTISQGTTTSASTTSQSTTSIIFSSCLSKNATQSIANGDFSTGTYVNWTTIGSGFGSAPLNLTYANNNGFYYGNATWSGYKGTFFATTYHGQNVQVGNITSSLFRVTELYLNFKIISPESDLLYVEILKNGMPAITTHYNTFATSSANALSTFADASIPLGTLLCQNLSIKVVAGITSSPVRAPSYIAVGDFYMSMLPVSTPGIVVVQNIT